MKIAINKCYGGFGLSKKAYEFLGMEWDGYGLDFNSHEKRNNPKLIECIETLGSYVASGECAEIKIVEIPDDVSWEIEEYDGIEWVAESHRIWS